MADDEVPVFLAAHRGVEAAELRDEVAVVAVDADVDEVPLQQYGARERFVEHGAGLAPHEGRVEVPCARMGSDPVGERLQEFGTDLVVGIEVGDPRAGRCRECRVSRGADAAVRQFEDADAAVRKLLGIAAGNHFHRAVGGAVVGHDELEVAECLAKDGVYGRAERMCAVVRRRYDREENVRRTLSAACRGRIGP